MIKLLHRVSRAGGVVMSMLIFMAGCVTSQPDIHVVRQTLERYQVGKTTFTDFEKDSGVMLKKKTIPKRTSYLAPDSMFSDLSAVKHYVTPQGSPWKIYETGTVMIFGRGQNVYITKMVVGDIEKPISILSFDLTGKLVEVAPVTISHPP